MRRLLRVLVPTLALRAAALAAGLAALAVVVASPAAPAGAQTTVLDRAAQELRRTPVYVDPAAERSISPAAAQDLRSRIAAGDAPIFIAVLPRAAVAEAGGDVNQLPSALGQRVGLAGTYAVVAGDSFRAGSNALPAGEAAALATSSFQAQSSAGTEAVLTTFVDRVNQASASGRPATGGNGAFDRPTATSPSGSGSGTGSVLLLVLLVGGGGLFLLSRRRAQRERRQVRRNTEADRQMLQAELTVLGDDVLSLESEVTLHPEARPDYDAGVTRYNSARAAMEYADDRVDLVRVRRVVDEGRYAMARARARVEGREPPPPPEELRRPGPRDEPALDLDERGAPVYVGSAGTPWYGGGWFGGGGGGLLTGLLLGEMLGGRGWGGRWGGWGGWGGGGGWGGWGGGGGDDDDRGGGDWGGAVGGGDWGGGGIGDLGGGGGDVGGGDW